MATLVSHSSASLSKANNNANTDCTYGAKWLASKLKSSIIIFNASQADNRTATSSVSESNSRSDWYNIGRNSVDTFTSDHIPERIKIYTYSSHKGCVLSLFFNTY